MKKPRDTFRKKWRRYLRLLPQDRALVRRAMFLVPFTKAGLRLLGFRRIKKLFDSFLASSAKKSGVPDTVKQKELAARIVRAAKSAELHGIGRPSCLERSLALWCLLRWNNIEAELQIGAQTRAGEFAAHAWVEWDGEVLNDSPDVRKRYAAFDPPIGVVKVNP